MSHHHAEEGEKGKSKMSTFFMSNELPRQKQFNFNSVVGIVCAALVGLAITKLDSLNTASIEQKKDLGKLTENVEAFRVKLNEFITKAEFNAALSARDKDIDLLKRDLATLKKGAKP